MDIISQNVNNYGLVLLIFVPKHSSMLVLACFPSIRLAKTFLKFPSFSHKNRFHNKMIKEIRFQNTRTSLQMGFKLHGGAESSLEEKNNSRVIAAVIILGLEVKMSRKQRERETGLKSLSSRWCSNLPSPPDTDHVHTEPPESINTSFSLRFLLPSRLKLCFSPL